MDLCQSNISSDAVSSQQGGDPVSTEADVFRKLMNISFQPRAASGVRPPGAYPYSAKVSLGDAPSQNDMTPYISQGHAAPQYERPPPSSTEQFMYQPPLGSGGAQAPSTSACAPPLRPEASTTPPPQVSLKDLKHTTMWLDWTEGRMGHFFINKVYLDEEKTKFWHPDQIKNSYTRVMSLQDLMPSKDLERALVINDRIFEDSIRSMRHLPKDCFIVLVCPQGESAYRDLTPGLLEVCPVHDADGKPGNRCSCTKRWPVKTIHPQVARPQDFSAKAIILRYKNSVRIIISSASYDELSWEKLAQFGWYCDLPIKNVGAGPVAEEAQDKASHPFESELFFFLDKIDMSLRTIVESVDFTKLSRAVTLLISTPGTVETSKGAGYGGFGFKNRIQKLHWPEKTNPVSICQTHRLGSSYPMNCLSELFHLRAKSAWPKVLFPSMQCLYDSTQRDPSLTRGNVDPYFGNRDKECTALKFLCDIQVAREAQIIPHANVLYQYQDLTDERGVKRKFGWIICGSQTLGRGSWGVRDHQCYRYFRYEIGVAVAPYVDVTETDAVTYAVDTSKIGFHFDDSPLTPYWPAECPFLTRHSMVAEEQLFWVFCTFARKNSQRNFGHADDTSTKYLEFRGYDRVLQNDLGRRVSMYIHVDRMKDSDYKNLPEEGQVLEVIAHQVAPNKIRAKRIGRIYDSLEDAVWKIGGVHIPPEEETVNQYGWEAERQYGWDEMFSEPEQKRPQTFQELMAEKGVKTEEDFEKLCSETFNTSYIEKYHQKYIETDPSIDYPMNPTKISDDTSWLEKHTRERFGGTVPPLTGPLHLHALYLPMYANLKFCFKGLEDEEDVPEV